MHHLLARLFADGPLMKSDDVAAWLRDTVTCGDLVLSASRNRLSRLIRWGTLSDYSHCAMALSNEWLFESYDWSGTPAEDDDGVAKISVDHYAKRGPLHRLAVLRPIGLDKDDFCRVAEHTTHHSPPFPSTVGILLAFAGLGDHPSVRIPGARRYVEKRLHLLGDGAARVTCAELAARVYLEAGMPLRFQTLRLLHYIELLRSGSWEKLHDDAEPRLVHTHKRSKQELTSLTAFVAGLPAAIAATSREKSMPDWADLLVPGDFMHSPSFHLVAQADVL